MRFLHTSDWHLGRNLAGHDLSEAQQVAVDAIVDTAIDRQVQAFVIAGDIFDRAFPSVNDIRRLNHALTRVHQAGIPIICTAGNHDEGARLAAFMNLLDHTVTVVGEYGQVGHAVELRDEHGPVIFYPLPYLDPDGARRDLAPSPDQLLPRSHEAVMSEAMRRVREDLVVRKQSNASTRAVVIAHAFVVTGKETAEELLDEQSQSERNIEVGGVPSVPSGVFDGVDYVALGHLHGPRNIGSGTSPYLRYSGSILRYSLSEMNHEKSCTVVDIDAKGKCTLEVVPIPQPAGMARLRGELVELLSNKYVKHYEDFVELLLTDERLPENCLAQLGTRYSRIMRAVPDRANHLGIAEPMTLEMFDVVKPIDTLRNFYQLTRKAEPSEAMVKILTDVLERATKDVEN